MKGREKEEEECEGGNEVGEWGGLGCVEVGEGDDGSCCGKG